MKRTRPTISTGTGDSGQTSLFCGGRVSKTDPQVAATGDCDELSTALGLAKAHCTHPARKEHIKAIQLDLITLMADISLNRYSEESQDFCIKPDRIEWLESLGKCIEDALPPLKDWDLPGADLESAALHMARTICRRCERSCLLVPEPHRASQTALLYLNRLSDLLFLLARSTSLPQL